MLGETLTMKRLWTVMKFRVEVFVLLFATTSILGIIVLAFLQNAISIETKMVPVLASDHHRQGHRSLRNAVPADGSRSPWDSAHTASKLMKSKHWSPHKKRKNSSANTDAKNPRPHHPRNQTDKGLDRRRQNGQLSSLKPQTNARNERQNGQLSSLKPQTNVSNENQKLKSVTSNYNGKEDDKLKHSESKVMEKEKVFKFNRPHSKTKTKTKTKTKNGSGKELHRVIRSSREDTDDNRNVLSTNRPKSLKRNQATGQDGGAAVKDTFKERNTKFRKPHVPERNLAVNFDTQRISDENTAGDNGLIEEKRKKKEKIDRKHEVTGVPATSQRILSNANHKLESVNDTRTAGFKMETEKDKLSDTASSLRHLVHESHRDAPSSNNARSSNKGRSLDNGVLGAKHAPGNSYPNTIDSGNTNVQKSTNTIDSDNTTGQKSTNTIDSVNTTVQKSTNTIDSGNTTGKKKDDVLNENKAHRKDTTSYPKNVIGFQLKKANTRKGVDPDNSETKVPTGPHIGEANMSSLPSDDRNKMTKSDPGKREKTLRLETVGLTDHNSTRYGESTGVSHITVSRQSLIASQQLPSVKPVYNTDPNTKVVFTNNKRRNNDLKFDTEIRNETNGNTLPTQNTHNHSKKNEEVLHRHKTRKKDATLESNDGIANASKHVVHNITSIGHRIDGRNRHRHSRKRSIGY